MGSIMGAVIGSEGTSTGEMMIRGRTIGGVARGDNVESRCVGASEETTDCVALPAPSPR